MLMLKAFGGWLVLVLLAVVNGALREKVLVTWLGRDSAAQLSVLLLCLLILLVTLAIVPFFGRLPGRQYWLIGAVWLVLTVAFEFLFGHYVLGDSWGKLLQSYNAFNGELWPLVLVVTAVSPYLAAWVRGMA